VTSAFDVVCAGVVYLDLTFVGLECVPRPGEEYWARDLTLSPGGMANTAVGLARLGLRTAVIGSIGQDLAGSYLRGALEAEGVVCLGPDVERSAMTAVLPIAGDRAMVSHLPREVASGETLRELQPRAVVMLVDQLEQVPAGLRVYALTSHAEVHAAANGTERQLPRTHALIANEAEALALSGESQADLAARLLSRTADTAVVTLGADGALAVSDGHLVHVAAPRTEVQDATGAGDLFAAAYVWADLAGYDLASRLQWASLYASRSLTTLTAFAGAGSLDDLVEAGRRAGLIN
jgi:sugar/nucleoside kinase (ribokinase family)